MQTYKIYIAEPDVIDVDLVKKVLGATHYALVKGDADFTVGEYASCDVAIIRSVAHIDASVKTKMPLLKHVVRVGTGLDTVDLDFCAKAGIAVYNAPGANAEAVADYAVTVIVMALRKLHLLQKEDVQTWNRFKFMGHDIATRTIGIVGFGNIGRLLYQKFVGLGCTNFLVYDPFVTAAPEHAKLVPIDELIKNSDVISLHLPLLPKTKHTINAQNIGDLKDDAILLNSSRGGIVDEAAVLEAMKTKHFAYIADTVEGEPHVNPKLIEQPNVIITPHIASLTKGAEAAMVTVAVGNFITGKQAVVVGA